MLTQGQLVEGQQSLYRRIDVPEGGDQSLQVGITVDKAHGVQLLQLRLVAHLRRLCVVRVVRHPVEHAHHEVVEELRVGTTARGQVWSAGAGVEAAAWRNIVGAGTAVAPAPIAAGWIRSGAGTRWWRWNAQGANETWGRAAQLL